MNSLFFKKHLSQTTFSSPTFLKCTGHSRYIIFKKPCFLCVLATALSLTWFIITNISRASTTLNLRLLDHCGTTKRKVGWNSNILALRQVNRGYSWSSSVTHQLLLQPWHAGSQKSFWGAKCCFCWVVTVSLLSSATWAQGCNKGKSKHQMQKSVSSAI